MIVIVPLLITSSSLSLLILCDEWIFVLLQGVSLDLESALCVLQNNIESWSIQLKLVHFTLSWSGYRERILFRKEWLVTSISYFVSVNCYLCGPVVQVSAWSRGGHCPWPSHTSDFGAYSARHLVLWGQGLVLELVGLVSVLCEKVR